MFSTDIQSLKMLKKQGEKQTNKKKNEWNKQKIAWQNDRFLIKPY